MNESDKHQAVEKTLCEQPLALRIPNSLDSTFNVVKDSTVLAEKLLRDRFNVERIVVELLDCVWSDIRGVSQIDLVEPLRGSAKLFQRAYRYAPE